MKIKGFVVVFVVMLFLSIGILAAEKPTLREYNEQTLVIVNELVSETKANLQTCIKAQKLAAAPAGCTAAHHAVQVALTARDVSNRHVGVLQGDTTTTPEQLKAAEKDFEGHTMIANAAGAALSECLENNKGWFRGLSSFLQNIILEALKRVSITVTLTGKIGMIDEEFDDIMWREIFLNLQHPADQILTDQFDN